MLRDLMNGFKNKPQSSQRTQSIKDKGFLNYPIQKQTCFTEPIDAAGVGLAGRNIEDVGSDQKGLKIGAQMAGAGGFEFKVDNAAIRSFLQIPQDGLQ